MTDLVLNPRAELCVDRRSGEIRGVTLRAPTRERGLQITHVTREDPPAVFEVLRCVAEGRSIDVDVDDHALGKLQTIGLLVPDGNVPRPVRLGAPVDSFKAPVDVPPPSALVVNPTLVFHDEIAPPPEGWVEAESVRRQRGAVRGEARVNGFSRECAWAWVRNDGIPAPTPIAVEEADRPLFRRLASRSVAPADLDEATRARLYGLGALVDPDAGAKQLAAYEKTRADGRATYAAHRYAVLRDLVHPAFIAALRRYYRALIAEGYAGYDDTLGRNRYWMHNEPVARVLHASLTDLVSHLVGEPMKTSYVYFGSYKNNALLVRHLDREQCPVSISLLVDYEPDPVGPSPWPLFLDLPSESLPVYLGLGDGLLFDGTRIHHHRPALADGHRSTSLFLHYVPVTFEGSLD